MSRYCAGAPLLSIVKLLIVKREKTKWQKDREPDPETEKN